MVDVDNKLLLFDQRPAAMAGAGECEWQLVKSGVLYDVWRCSACGYEHAESRTDPGATELDPNFCPNCGGRVKEVSQTESLRGRFDESKSKIRMLEADLRQVVEQRDSLQTMLAEARHAHEVSLGVSESMDHPEMREELEREVTELRAEVDELTAALDCAKEASAAMVKKWREDVAERDLLAAKCDSAIRASKDWCVLAARYVRERDDLLLKLQQFQADTEGLQCR